MPDSGEYASASRISLLVAYEAYHRPNFAGVAWAGRETRLQSCACAALKAPQLLRPPMTRLPSDQDHCRLAQLPACRRTTSDFPSHPRSISKRYARSENTPHLHSNPIRPQLQIPLPPDLAIPTQTLFRVAQMRVQDLLRQRQLAPLRQDPPDIFERFE